MGNASNLGDRLYRNSAVATSLCQDSAYLLPWLYHQRSHHDYYNLTFSKCLSVDVQEA